jgi:hypothetical protein
MNTSQLVTLKFFSLVFLLPGLAGLVLSAVISTHYLDTLPRWPAPEEMRMTPRSIHGVLVYQTAAENRRLNLIEGSSVGIFAVGMILGAIYLEKWGSARARLAEEKEELLEGRS